MKTILWIGLGVVAVFALVLVGLLGGWALWGRQVWATEPYAQPDGGYRPPVARGGWGPGMMGRGGAPRTDYGSPEVCGWGGRGRGMGWDGDAPCAEYGDAPEDPASAAPQGALSIDEAYEAAEAYVDWLDYPNLDVTEVMEFEHNFYAIVAETETGIGAMELLIDKESGDVGPEMGPNMMWNTRYGMHGRGGRGGGMMGWSYRNDGTNAVSAEEALEIAQEWLDANLPGVTVEDHADPFYGYYTIHTLADGEIEGMLSVHGTTGQVWYHTWHGAFIDMLETGEGEGH